MQTATSTDATRLPDFVVLGQGKAGTSLIYRVLQCNPLIGLSQPKELHYFTAHFDKGPDWYADHFSDVPETAQLIGEVSPSYLSSRPIARIAEALGRNTKVIFVLRRPIEQAYSRYLQNICASKQGDTFPVFMQRLSDRLNELMRALELCFDTFGPDKVLPMFYERDITGDAPVFEQKILEFIGLPQADHYETMRGDPVVNPGVMPRYLFSGDKRLPVFSGGNTYRIPPQNLVFCGQTRNSKSWKKPEAADVLTAWSNHCRWSTEVTREKYARWQAETVLPFADQLEQKFGFDMSHWRNEPVRIKYDLAPPPMKFIVAQDGNADAT